MREMRAASRRDDVDGEEEETAMDEGGFGDMIDERAASAVSHDARATVILEMAAKMAALELDNARLEGIARKRSQIEAEEEEEKKEEEKREADRLAALQQQVKANQKQIKQLRKLLSEIVEKVCAGAKGKCPENPLKTKPTKETTMTTTKKPVAAKTKAPAQTTVAPPVTTPKATVEVTKVVVTKPTQSTKKQEPAKTDSPTPNTTTPATTT